MHANFDASLARLLAHEGGYTNHPSDPGGPTNFGITIFDYRKYVRPDAGADDVRVMKLDEAKAIYRAKYWNALRCDELPAGLDYAVFDYGVNSGVSRAAKVLQRSLGVPDDGRIGPLTLAAAAKCDARRVVMAICAERRAFLQSLPTWPVFGRGWSRRVAAVEVTALQLAGNATQEAWDGVEGPWRPCHRARRAAAWRSARRAARRCRRKNPGRRTGRGRHALVGQ